MVFGIVDWKDVISDLTIRSIGNNKDDMSKVVFVKYLKFNNDKCIRTFPYQGESWWVIKSIHYNRFIKLITDKTNPDKDFTNRKNWKIVEGEDMKGKDIYSIDYKLMNSYVVGESDIIPELIPFNPKLHCSDWSHSRLLSNGFSKYEIEKYGYPYWFMKPNYQILIKK